MRDGEARTNLAGWVRRKYGFIVIPKSKNNARRYVALSHRASQCLLQQAEGEPDDGLVFRFQKNSCEHEWQKIRMLAGCPDLRIHDLRHEALSRMSGNGADF
ncbi:tyrosine-type recombinase/integrase [Rhizobium leguminosarum]|nr:tyrosine-type recombinase/integrase [Rhizobium leguminosarum]